MSFDHLAGPVDDEVVTLLTGFQAVERGSPLHLWALPLSCREEIEDPATHIYRLVSIEFFPALRDIRLGSVHANEFRMQARTLAVSPSPPCPPLLDFRSFGYCCFREGPS